jgi:hypothetical protein
LATSIRTSNGTSTISENSTWTAEDFAHETSPWNSEKVVDETNRYASLEALTGDTEE